MVVLVLLLRVVAAAVVVLQRLRGEPDLPLWVCPGGPRTCAPVALRPLPQVETLVNRLRPTIGWALLLGVVVVWAVRRPRLRT